MLEKDSSVLKDYEAAVQYEWLETNGLGGWSSSTIIGCHTRRYHGLLVAATVPPAERMSLLSKLEETIILNNQRFALGTNNFGDAIYPEGYKYASSFTKDLFPVFTYQAGAVQLQKTISMVNAENTVVINYKLLKAPGTCQLELLPLFSVRDYHSLMQANNDINQQATFQEDIFTARLYEGTTVVYIKVPGAAFQPDPCWFRHFHYSVEHSRGLNAEEDLFSYGKFSVAMKEGESLGIIISTSPPGKKEALVLLQTEKERKLKLLKNQPADIMLQQLMLAADQFIVQRMLPIALPHETAREGATVIAGYHWFADWARDTMIALPGLTLSTGRYAEARKILAAFTSAVSEGMLPNRFMDNGQPPEYNTVDGTLWYFVAVFKYLQATADRDFVLQQILPVLKDIIAWHFKGTRYNIHVADDGLLFAGQTGQQLTWMDAKVDDWVVTPRTGKPVEIQALWYNALKIFSALLVLNGKPTKLLTPMHMQKLPEKVLRRNSGVPPAITCMI